MEHIGEWINILVVNFFCRVVDLYYLYIGMFVFCDTREQVEHIGE